VIFVPSLRDLRASFVIFVLCKKSDSGLADHLFQSLVHGIVVRDEFFS
jgi:hypothetical protein